MQKIILTVGLSGSGKSTWAKKMVQDNPGKYKRINKDDLRAMLDVSRWSKANEQFVIQVRDSITISALESGYSVIWDDTNLHQKHLDQAKEIANNFKLITSKIIQVESNVLFLEVPIETCIKQDLKRFNSVGEAVIRKQYEEFVKPPAKTLVQDSLLPKCFIVDIDGTVANMNGKRKPFEWHKVGEDTPIKHVVDLIKHLSETFEIVFMSGRDESCRFQTEEWLNEHFDHMTYDLFMRPENDFRKDNIIKQELYESNVKDKWYVKGVFDDRDQVIEYWRSEGLQTYQCNYGNF